MAFATDDFNRSNGALGSDWTTNTGPGGQIVSNAFGAASAPPVYEGSHWSTDTFTADQYSEATKSTTGQFLAVAVRMSAAGGGSWYAWFDNGSVQRSITGSVNASIATTSTFANGDTVRLEIVGTTLEFFKNGVSQGTHTDANISTGQPGLMIVNNGDLGAMDDWQGGDVGSGPGTVLTIMHHRMQQGMS